VCSRSRWQQGQDAVAPLWIDLLGLALEGSYRSERENATRNIGCRRGPARCEIDLMQPLTRPWRPAVHDRP